MLTVLWIVYVLDCLLLIGIILLQPGEGLCFSGYFNASTIKFTLYFIISM